MAVSAKASFLNAFNDVCIFKLIFFETCLREIFVNKRETLNLSGAKHDNENIWEWRLQTFGDVG